MTDAATRRLDAERLAGGDVIDIGLGSTASDTT